MSDSAGESDFVDWVRCQVSAGPRVILGPGDDAALLHFPQPANCIITTDMLLDGSCFRLAEAGPYRVGRKAMAVNLSDIAAMAGVPLAAVVSVGLPRNAAPGLAKDLFRGLSDVAKEFQTSIVGGDTNSWEGPLAISITLLGESTTRGAVKRSGARNGDWLFVTGRLGGSILGHHLDFTPRVRESLELANLFELHAMTDISDGFSLDLSHIAKESGCGAVVFAENIPISEAATKMNDDRDALTHALEDGEDFELIFAVSPDDGRRLLTNPDELSFPVFHIGECVESGFWMEKAGHREQLTPAGFEHRFNS